MTVAELLESERARILEIARHHGAHHVRVFGSVVHGDARPNSDVDFLVDFEPGRSLLDHSALVAELEALLGRKVDVVTEKGLYWLLRRRILKEARPL